MAGSFEDEVKAEIEALREFSQRQEQRRADEESERHRRSSCPTYDDARFLQLLHDAKAEHRRAARGEAVYPSPELELRLIELGQAVEAGKLSEAVMAKARRGSSILGRGSPPSSS